MSFNIKSASTSVKDSTFLHLRHPATDEKLMDGDNPVGINLYGKASKQYKQVLSELSRKTAMRKGKPNSFEGNVEDNVSILVAISKEGVNLDYNDVALDSPEAFRQMYSDSSLYWVRDQVQDMLEDTAAFLA